MTLTADALPAAMAEFHKGLLDAGLPEDVANVATLDLGRELYRHLDLTGIKAPRRDVASAAEARRVARERELATVGGQS